jgi:hypothetical protein
MSEEITQRLSDYSTRTNVNAMNIALIEQRMAVVERRQEEYHLRLHKVEDENLVMKTVQSIHDAQIQGVRKILIGNGDRETIPMDMDRMERAIQDILKVDWTAMRLKTEDLEKWKEAFTARMWQIWMLVIGLAITSIWGIFFK